MKLRLLPALALSLALAAAPVAAAEPVTVGYQLSYDPWKVAGWGGFGYIDVWL